MAKSFCVSCQETFKSVLSFDKHRVGGYGDSIYRTSDTGKQTKDILGYTPSTRHCMTEQEMLDTGMVKNDKGWWIASIYDANAHSEEEV